MGIKSHFGGKKKLCFLVIQFVKKMGQHGYICGFFFKYLFDKVQFFGLQNICTIFLSSSGQMYYQP